MTTTVTELQDDAQTYAAELGKTMDTLVAELKGFRDSSINSHDVSWAGHTFLDSISERLEDLIVAEPEELDLDEPNAAEPADPSISDVVQPEDIPLPEFTDVPPVLAIPVVPTTTDPTEPATPSEPTTPSLPEAPAYQLPALPSLSEISIPDAPAFNLPHFTASSPDLTLTAPTNNFAFAETPYASNLLDTIDAKLLSDLENGGYGIETADELMLIDRARERENETGERAMDEATQEFAAKRYDLPPGALLETMQRGREAIAAATNTLSREIALKRYDQLVTARQFALQQGVAVENLRMTFHGAMMERMLNAARYTADAAIAYFNAQIEAAKLQQANYESQARVFESLVRAEVEKLNIWRTQLEAQRLKGDIDRLKIEQYRVEVEAVRAAYDLYNTRLRGVELVQSVERLKIERYRGAIEAYTARIRANEVRFQQYEAQIRGEATRAQLFETQVRAFDARVRTVESRVQMQRLKLTSQIETNRSNLELYTGRINAYRTKLEGQVGIRRLRVDNQTQKWRGYEARARAFESGGRLAIENYRSNTEDFLGVMRHNLDKAKYLLTVDETNRNWKGDVTSKILSFYSPLVSAALSSVNTLGVQTESA